MSIDNSVNTDLKIINDLTNKLLSGEEIHILELDVLKDALKKLYKEVLKIELFSQQECNDENSDEQLTVIIPPFVEENNKDCDIEVVQKEEISEEKVFVEEEINENETFSDQEIISNQDSSDDIIIEDKNQNDLFDVLFDEPKNEFNLTDVEKNADLEYNIQHEETGENFAEGEQINSEQTDDEVIIIDREVVFIEGDKVIPEDEMFFDDKMVLDDEIRENKTMTIAERLSSVSSTVADTITVENKNTIADKVSKEKISNIKLAIGINDKFYFINRLFDGDVNFYNETIEKFNNFSSLNDAKILLQLLINKYNWDFEDDAFRKFEDIIERRY
ncbi:hypothetical protein LJC25_00795 [Bacteroidales bacterium OttesenSCG-928-K03]|nr:hypothetical protein [Bacteroidales bacterium OttesenSCG-928-K22]MDL2242248.1 hypothetical protein [Bacteroidales bacterium OttesenSCG-928-K03]